MINEGILNSPFSSADHPIEVPSSVQNQLHHVCQLRRGLGLRRRPRLRVVSRRPQQLRAADDLQVLRGISRDGPRRREAVLREED